MIHSVFDPVAGLWEHLECPDRIGVNDDHPTPVFPSGMKLGIPSTIAARPLPQGCRRIGAGPHVRGTVSSRSSIVRQGPGADMGGRDPSLGAFEAGSGAGLLIAAGAVAAVAAFFLCRRL